ncbi:MAG: Flagellin N-methylase [Verrucomicrobiales bacterium]|nr:Flagellin N-methylase [Verrucomicrobiales bacterium]
MQPEANLAETLCLACGLCCNGVIFADVQLQRGDNAGHLRELGMLKRNATKLPQPCSAHDGCRCAIYSDRPKYCQQFECLLLKNAQEGRTTETEALRVIKDARKKAARVQELLANLGDNDATVALSKRFQSVRRKMESGGGATEQIEIFGLLTVAVHELNVVLSERFYR